MKKKKIQARVSGGMNTNSSAEDHEADNDDDSNDEYTAEKEPQQRLPSPAEVNDAGVNGGTGGETCAPTPADNLMSDPSVARFAAQEAFLSHFASAKRTEVDTTTPPLYPLTAYQRQLFDSSRHLDLPNPTEMLRLSATQKETVPAAATPSYPRDVTYQTTNPTESGCEAFFTRELNSCYDQEWCDLYPSRRFLNPQLSYPSRPPSSELKTEPAFPPTRESLADYSRDFGQSSLSEYPYSQKHTLQSLASSAVPGFIDSNQASSGSQSSSPSGIGGVGVVGAEFGTSRSSSQVFGTSHYSHCPSIRPSNNHVTEEGLGRYAAMFSSLLNPNTFETGRTESQTLPPGQEPQPRSCEPQHQRRRQTQAHESSTYPLANSEFYSQYMAHGYSQYPQAETNTMFSEAGVSPSAAPMDPMQQYCAPFYEAPTSSPQRHTETMALPAYQAMGFGEQNLPCPSVCDYASVFSHVYPHNKPEDNDFGPVSMFPPAFTATNGVSLESTLKIA
ncbi:unnamed protein product [Dibothriocephalus latus]|uniref:Uncharacterized protein n=1 Tax=Dibothriocephalus latus TaxID=60516 RepID=A0A3P6T1A1_DIBLA|nr:unnamed protein product [Dibothriocephalus latus]